MPDVGYPSDWSQHYHKCYFCKHTYHDSHCTECLCRECRYCTCSHPPNEMVSEDVCEHCAESGCWAWLDDWKGPQGLDHLLYVVQGMFDSGADHGIETREEILTNIRNLKSALELVDKRLVDGFDKTLSTSGQEGK
jgi:hypothetical protein